MCLISHAAALDKFIVEKFPTDLPTELQKDACGLIYSSIAENWREYPYFNKLISDRMTQTSFKQFLLNKVTRAPRKSSSKNQVIILIILPNILLGIHFHVQLISLSLILCTLISGPQRSKKENAL